MIYQAPFNQKIDSDSDKYNCQLLKLLPVMMIQINIDFICGTKPSTFYFCNYFIKCNLILHFMD